MLHPLKTQTDRSDFLYIQKAIEIAQHDVFFCTKKLQQDQ